MFVLKSDVTIGNFRFTGVNNVGITKSIHSIVERALIKIPSIGRITKDGKVLPETIVTAKQFKQGDAVKIRLGYNSHLETEFIGFVCSIDMNMPLTITCEGYSWLMRRNSLTGFYKKISLKELLKLAVSTPGNKISVICDQEIDFCNILLDHITGVDLVKKILEFTDDTLTCFFIRPDTLWCGFTSSSYSKASYKMNTVEYRLGYNTIKENTLKIKDVTNDTVEVSYSKRLSNGTVFSKSSTVFKNPLRRYKKVLNHIASAATLKILADEKASRMCYVGYEGKLTAFLQPYVGPGYQAMIMDKRLGDQQNLYLVESVEIQYGKNGARRIIESGIKLGNKS